MASLGAFGDQLGRYFGLAGAPSLATPSGDCPQFAVTRLFCTVDQLGLKQAIPPEDAFVLALHLIAVDHLEIWRHGRPISARSYPRGSISIHNLNDKVSVYIGGPLDCLCFYIPRATFDHVTDGVAEPRITDLACPLGRSDPTIEQIGLALLPLLRSPESMAPAFLNHIGLATSLHLAQAYGNFRPKQALHRFDRFSSRWTN